MPPPQALAIAKQKGLDLVEISPTAVPPVCRIMDFGKYQYQEQKRAREARKHQKVIEVKEIKFRPKVDEHDYQFKKKHIERFLEDGDKVKATIFFRGREMAHPEIGRRILERLIRELADVALAETMPRMEGNQMHTILTRRPQSGGGKAKAAERRRRGKRRNAVTANARRAQRGTCVQRSLRSNVREDGEKSEEDQTEDTPRRRQALQADEEREVSAGQGVQAAHPEQQDQEAEAPAARNDDGGRRRHAEARADAAVHNSSTIELDSQPDVAERSSASLDVQFSRWRQRDAACKTRNSPARQAQEAAGLAKGYYANKSKLYRAAKESVDTALKYAFVGRRRKKRDFRRLWVVRINAAAREHGLTYGQLINGLKNAGVTLDRKSLSGAGDRQPGGVRDAGEAGQGRGEDAKAKGQGRQRTPGRKREGLGARGARTGGGALA